MRFPAVHSLASTFLVLLASCLTAACDQGSSQKVPAPPPASVIVAPVSLEDLNSERTFTGRIEAIDKVQIRARVQGFLKSRHCDEGAKVEKGELLYEIEPEPFELSVEQAEANVASASAAETFSQQTFERTEELVRRNTSSRASLDEAQSGLAQAHATLQARKAELQNAQLNLSYTKISAPIAGRIGRSAYSVGNLVGPESNPLVLLVSQDPVYANFPVPQWLLVQVRKAGQGPDSVYVKLRLADGSEYEQTGSVEFTDVQATTGTDSVLVRAKVPNPDGLLVDQQLINVQVIRKKPEKKLVISQSALLLDQQGAYALVVDDANKVQIKRITVGEQRGSLIVVDSGLEAGDRVIVSGHQKARPGAEVAPQMADNASGGLASGAGAKSP